MGSMPLSDDFFHVWETGDWRIVDSGVCGVRNRVAARNFLRKRKLGRKAQQFQTFPGHQAKDRAGGDTFLEPASNSC